MKIKKVYFTFKTYILDFLFINMIELSDSSDDEPVEVDSTTSKYQSFYSQ